MKREKKGRQTIQVTTSCQRISEKNLERESQAKKDQRTLLIWRGSTASSYRLIRYTISHFKTFLTLPEIVALRMKVYPRARRPWKSSQPLRNHLFLICRTQRTAPIAMIPLTKRTSML